MLQETLPNPKICLDKITQLLFQHSRVQELFVEVRYNLLQNSRIWSRNNQDTWKYESQDYIQTIMK